MKRLLILSLAAIFAACGSIKLTDSSYAMVSESKAELDQYVFKFQKKAGAYLEVVEVKLLNKENGMETSVPFQVMDVEGTKSVLDVKGRSEFAVVASKPKGDESAMATSALIVYKTEPDGDKKYYTVKKIGE